MKLLTLAAVSTVAVLLAACTPMEEKEREATICKSFSFSASGKTEITEARKQFYEAGMYYGVEFSDDIRWGGPAVFNLGGGRLVLNYGDGSYLKSVPDSALELTITWYDKAIIREGLRTTPCTFSGTEETYEKIKMHFSKRWRITKSRDTAYAIKLPGQ